MGISRWRRRGALVVTAMALAMQASSADALSWPKFGGGKPPVSQPQVDELIKEIDQALDEGRLLDAGQLINDAYLRQIDDKRVVLRSGELNLAQQRYPEAIQNFSEVENLPAERARALQGKGIALAELGRGDDAVAALKSAVQLDPTLWRAWNVLAVESDRSHDWVNSEGYYANALKAPGVKPIVFNNRGYSRMLQGRYGDAPADFVRALELDPGLAVARTNLRLALALGGEYRRATEVSGVEDRGTVLNNAGFAAVLRGDYPQAEQLFQQAVDARGSAYGRALENLKMVKALKSGQSEPGKRQ